MKQEAKSNSCSTFAGFLHKEKTKLQCMPNASRVQTLCKCFCKV